MNKKIIRDDENITPPMIMKNLTPNVIPPGISIFCSAAQSAAELASSAEDSGGEMQTSSASVKATAAKSSPIRRMPFIFVLNRIYPPFCLVFDFAVLSALIICPHRRF